MGHAATKAFVARPLTLAEQTLLQWLLTHGAELTGTHADLAESYLKQIGSLQVVGQCDCGCPTIDLTLAASSLAVAGVSATLADVEGYSPEGSEIGVILRATDGWLSELELYPIDGRVPFSIPAEEQLRSFR